MTRNPFEIFGLTPEMVARLSEKELFSVLKSMYRALQKTVHPDVARRSTRKNDLDRAVELNLAFEALDLDKNPVTFRRHRKNFAARRPRLVYQKSLDLEKQLIVQKSKEDRLAEAYLNRLVADHGWSKSEESLVNKPFPLVNIRLGLLDVAINQNLKMASWALGSNYKEINFDAKGQMTVRQIGRSNFSKAAYIHLLGSVELEAAQLLPLLDRPEGRFFKAPALNGSIGANGPAISVLNRISQENFKNHLLTYLKPQVTERSYLFSINRPEFEETGCLTLEGQVVKIEDHSSPEAAG